MSDTLTVDQMIWMMNHHNAIIAAYDRDELSRLDEFIDTDEYRNIFGAMDWDTAYDLYETAERDADARARCHDLVDKLDTAHLQRCEMLLTALLNEPPPDDADTERLPPLSDDPR